MKTATVFEGEKCSFECVLSHDIIDEASWTLNGQLIVSNGRIEVANKGRKYTLTIHEVMTSDAGDVVFTIKDLSCRTMMFVKGTTSTVFEECFDFAKCELNIWSMLSFLREACEGLQGHAKC